MSLNSNKVLRMVPEHISTMRETWYSKMPCLQETPTLSESILAGSFGIADISEDLKTGLTSSSRDKTMKHILQFFATSKQLRSIRYANFTIFTDPKVTTVDSTRSGVSHRTSPDKSQTTMDCSISKSHAAFGGPHIGGSHPYNQANFTLWTSIAERRIPSSPPSLS
jgi:hypothetical protein